MTSTSGGSVVPRSRGSSRAGSAAARAAEERELAARPAMVRLACMGPQLVALTKVGERGEGDVVSTPRGDALLEFLALEDGGVAERGQLRLAVLARRDRLVAKFGLTNMSRGDGEGAEMGAYGGSTVSTTSLPMPSMASVAESGAGGTRVGGAVSGAGLVRGRASEAEWSLAGVVRVWGDEGPGKQRFDVLHSEDPDCDCVVPAEGLRANMRGWRLAGSFWTFACRRLFVFEAPATGVREVHALPRPELFGTHRLVDSFLCFADEVPGAKKFTVLAASDLSGRTLVTGAPHVPREGWEPRFHFAALVLPAFRGLASRTLFKLRDDELGEWTDLRADLPTHKAWTVQDRIFVVP
jgi:hypothetical protein